MEKEGEEDGRGDKEKEKEKEVLGDRTTNFNNVNMRSSLDLSAHRPHRPHRPDPKALQHRLQTL